MRVRHLLTLTVVAYALAILVMIGLLRHLSMEMVEIAPLYVPVFLMIAMVLLHHASKPAYTPDSFDQEPDQAMSHYGLFLHLGAIGMMGFGLFFVLQLLRASV